MTTSVSPNPLAHIWSIADVRRFNEKHGYHFFEHGAMRFFRSRILDGVYISADHTRIYFVTSEQYQDSRGNRADRYYSIRQLLPTGSIDTVGAFQAYTRADQARRLAQKLAQALD